MANVKELRLRIKSVGNIRQITKAMEMVASMKLRKVQAKAQANRPYTEEIRGLVGRLAASSGSEERQPLFDQREQKTIGVLVLTSDRGLCGAYNSNLLSHVDDQIEELAKAYPGAKLKFYCYGRKGYAYLSRRKFDIEKFFVEPPLDKADFAAAKHVSDTLVADFLSKKIDAAHLVYSRFASMIRFVPTWDAFLPVTNVPKQRAATEKRSFSADYLLEPDAKTIFARLLPRYLETVVYDAIVQSLASEHASRRMAMKGATDAATRMGKELKTEYNRARQESITKELLDIVGGASAVS